MEELLRRRGTVLVLGASDSGKSTLARYLIEGFLAHGVRAAFVDSDIGQSSLGLPGTISMKVFDSPADLADFSPKRVFFIGAMSPARAIPRMIDGTRGMVEAARAGGAEAVVVDTTGLISGEVGRALKMGKVRALRPDHVVAIQRGEELEHILSLIRGPGLHRLRASRLAKRRSRPARIAYREGKFASYMKGARTASLKAEGREFVLRGRPIEMKGMKEMKEVETGTLLGLNRGEETIAVGVLLGIKEGKVIVRTPLRAFSGINRVLIGEMTIGVES